MTVLTKQRTVTIILNTPQALKWVDDNIAVERSQWDKDDDTGNLCFYLDAEFADELLDEMADELQEKIDFTVR